MLEPQELLRLDDKLWLYIDEANQPQSPHVYVAFGAVQMITTSCSLRALVKKRTSERVTKRFEIGTATPQ